MKLQHKFQFIFLLFFIITSNQLFSQSDSPERTHKKNNLIFFEGLGHGVGYSINYERNIFEIKRFHASGQVGFAIYGGKNFIPSLVVPICFNQSIKISKREFIEIGVGKLFHLDNVDTINEKEVKHYSAEWIFRLGLKYHFKNNKWIFKIAYTPFYIEKSNFIHWGGVAFGYKF